MDVAQPVCGFQPVVTEPPADPAGPAPADLPWMRLSPSAA